MAEAIVDNYQWESDEADWEADDAVPGEADEAVEDIGERTRYNRRNRYRPTQGVQGIRLRRPDGGAQTVRFPAKLPTTAEVNRGLASQELGRRALEDKLARLEKQLGRQIKNDSGVSGFVTLAIGGGLTAYGAVKAAEAPADKLKNWTNQGSTRIASVISATQLATTGAKLVINGRYHRSGLGTAADIFSVAQLATFVFGTFSSPRRSSSVRLSAVAADYNDAFAALGKGTYREGDVVAINDTGSYLRVVRDDNKNLVFEPV